MLEKIIDISIHASRGCAQGNLRDKHAYGLNERPTCRKLAPCSSRSDRPESGEAGLYESMTFTTHQEAPVERWYTGHFNTFVYCNTDYDFIIANKFEKRGNV
jgi:hypothetical protein